MRSAAALLLTVTLSLVAAGAWNGGVGWAAGEASTGRLGVTIVADIHYSWSFTPDGRMIVLVRNLPAGEWRIRAMEDEQELGGHVLYVCAPMREIAVEVWPTGPSRFTVRTVPELRAER